MAKAFVSIVTASATALSLILGACQMPAPSQSYDYTQSVPEGDLMGEEWFDDSCIIGHSLVEGFEGFAQVSSNIHYFSSTGLSAAGALSYKKFDLPDGGTGTLETGLSQREFSKVYVMLGVNEISASSSSFKKNMGGIVDLIREKQGEDIPIYLINLTPTTKKKSDSTPFNKDNITRLNEALRELCGEKECYYIDLYSCFADDDGYLPSKNSTDGVHISASQYKVMADYLKSHTVAQ